MNTLLLPYIFNIIVLVPIGLLTLLGGLRGILHLRAILSNIGVLVLPDQVAVSKANEQFTGEGLLADAGLQAIFSKCARSWWRRYVSSLHRP